MKNREERASWLTRAKTWATRTALVMVTFGVIVSSADAAAGKIGKLQKKVAKVEATIEAKMAKVATTQGNLALQQQALADGVAAQAAAALLPQTTKAEIKLAKKAIKAADKAVKKATKRINKMTKKIAKLQNQIANKTVLVAALEQKLDELIVGGLPGAGDIGVKGLKLPELMTMFSPTATDGGPDGFTGTVGTSGGAPGPVMATLGLPQQSDYFADESHTWVYDPSMDSLESVNEILCMIRQAAHDAMVNEGAYLVQIDPNLCSTGGSADGQQAVIEEVELWTIESQRKDETSQHVVGVWAPQEAGSGPSGNEPAATIQARMAIVEAPSDSNPHGVFALDFESLASNDTNSDPLFWGTLQTEDGESGSLGFSYFETSGVAGSDDHSERAVHVSIASDGQGIARVYETITGDFGPGGSTQTETNTYLLAFDDDNVLRQQDVADPVCLDRNEFETSVWHYNLYEASGPDAGSLVTRTSGFGIATDQGDYGWAGYDGLWLPPQVDVQSGDTVVKNTFDSGDSPEQYTVMKAPGKLLRVTQNTLGLAGIDGMQFEWYGVVSEVEPASVTVGGGPGTVGTPGADDTDVPVVRNYLVEYSYSVDQFTVIGSLDDDHQFSPLVPEVVLNTGEVGYLDMWSSTLNGAVSYVHGDSEVTFYAQEIVSGNDDVFGADGTLQLYGYMDALASDITGADAAAGEVFMETVTKVATPYFFVMDRDDLTLYHDVEGDGSVLTMVGLADGETYSSGPFADGMRSGPMVTEPGLLSGVLDVWNQSEFYLYETGPNDWNKHTSLIDSNGDYVDFEPPLQFTYTHSTEADRNGSAAYDGQVFQLQFFGAGELQGIPTEGVDFDGDGDFDRYYPVFDIADGTLVGPTGSEYLVRGIEMEQRLAPDVDGCTTLSLGAAAALALPDGSDFEKPNLGEEPAVSGPPAVISGVVQED